MRLTCLGKFGAHATHEKLDNSSIEVGEILKVKL